MPSSAAGMSGARVTAGARMTSRTLKTLMPNVSHRPVEGSEPSENSRISSLLVPASVLRASAFLRGLCIVGPRLRRVAADGGVELKRSLLEAFGFGAGFRELIAARGSDARDAFDRGRKLPARGVVRVDRCRRF